MHRARRTNSNRIALGLTFLAVAAGGCAAGSGADDSVGSMPFGPPGPAAPVATGGVGAGAMAMAGTTGALPAATVGAAGMTPGPIAGTTGGGVAGTTGEFAGTGGMGGTGGVSGSGSGGKGSGESSCLDGITSFATDGPFKFQTATSGSVKMWAPDVPAGCKVPVIHLANGTGGTCASYAAVLTRFASHGFLTTCFESGQTGNGSQGMTAYEAAYTKYPDLAGNMIGSTGHSQGGQAAFTVLQLAEAKWGDSKIYTGLAMEPASGFGAAPTGGTWQAVYKKIKSPMFMFSGTADTLVSASWVAQALAALDPAIEAYNWSAVGATHVPVPAAPTQEVGVPWFRWKLLGDNEACKAFKALTSGAKWKSTKEQNAKPCM